MALCEELAPQMLRLYLSRPGNHLRIIPMGSVAIALEGKPQLAECTKPKA